MTTALLEDRRREELWAGSVIDCDVHAQVPNLQVLEKYQEPVWREAARERGWRGPRGAALSYPPGAATSVREQWRGGDLVAATSVDALQQHILDPWNVDRAVLNCYFGVDSVRHPDWAASLASAVNDWLIHEWLEKDARLAGTMVIPARDPQAAAREIERVGGHPQIVQVMLPVRSERLYGQRIFHPVFEAMVRHDLVAGLQWGGTTEEAPSPTGYASWYAEEYAAEVQVYGSQITSMVFEGLFQKFPGLRVSVMEGGFMWLPMWAWFMNKKWKGLRREIPWVNRPPMDIIRDHFRFSVAPSDLGPKEHSRQVIEWLRADELLMYASDYPHLHTDDLVTLIDILPEPGRAAMMSETARRWYGL